MWLMPTEILTPNIEVEERLSIPARQWPPQSPDLNIIENLWRDLKYAVQSRSPKYFCQEK